MHYNPLILQPNDEIWYVSTDGNIVEPYSGATIPFADVDGNNIQIISNTYEDDKGIIRLQKECYQIGISAFGFCSSLASITIPESVTSIGNRVFSNCTSLTGITIPDSVTSIGNEAFVYCASLTGITIPDSVTSIGNEAFVYCASLTGITIPDKVTSIGIGAFEGCSRLENITVLPGTPPTLGLSVFNNIASNAAIYVPNLDYFFANNWYNYRSKMALIE